MTTIGDQVQPPTVSKEARAIGSRGVTAGLLVGLVLCLLLAVGVAFWDQHEIAALRRERDAARREVQKLTTAAAAATAANATQTERLILTARAELAELAHLLVMARQNPNPGKDIKDPVLPASIAGKRRNALNAAFALKDAKVPFTWGGRRKEDGVDSVGFVAVALSEAGMLLKPEILTAKSLQNLLNVATRGEPQPGDILFFDSGIVMFYLGGDNAVGMLPEGAATKGGVLKGKGIGFKYLGYGTIRYD